MNWIKCSERLPELNRDVLGLLLNNKRYEYVVVNLDSRYWYFLDGIIPREDIIYWMPLPEPPED